MPRLGLGTLAPNERISGWLAYEVPVPAASAASGAQPFLRECLLSVPVGSKVEELDLLEIELEHGVKTRPSSYDRSIPVLEVKSRINGLNVHKLIEGYESRRETGEDFVILFTSEDLLIDRHVASRLRSERPTTDWVRKHAYWTNVPIRAFSRVPREIVGGLFRSLDSEATAMSIILSGRENGHELLIEKLANSSAEARVAAVRELRSHCNSPGVIPALEKAVADEEAVVRAAAIHSLSAYYGGSKTPDSAALPPPKLEGDALEQILEAAADPAVNVRSAAIRLLGSCRDPRAEAVVVRTISESDATLRRAAIGALRDSKSPQAVKILLGALNDSDPAIRRQAVWSAGGHPVGAFGRPIMDLLDHDDVGLIISACRTLGELQFQAAVPKLRQLLTHKHIGIARASADALKKLGELRDEDALLLEREQGVIPAPPLDAAAINKLLTPEQRAVSEAITNSIGMVMVPIPAGEFQMGSPDKQSQHLVKITKPFHLCAFEVTQGHYGKVMGTGFRSAAFFVGHTGVHQAMSWMSHDVAVEFCRKLSALPKEKAANREHRLPTEAEWEYACRAGTTTTYSFGNDPSQLDAYGWYADNSGRQAHSVGQKKPNPWGLYDMHGNVEEPCSDWYGDHPSAPTMTDPIGPDDGSERVVRGGSYSSAAKWCTSAGRSPIKPSSHGDRRGIRAVMVPSGGETAKPKN